jgi:hypothetical protein
VRSTIEPGNKKPRLFPWLVLLGICLLSILTYTGALACGWGNNGSPWSTASAHGCAPWMQQSQGCTSPTAVTCGGTVSQSQICVFPTTPVQPCDSTTGQDPACASPTTTIIPTTAAIPPTTTVPPIAATPTTIAVPTVTAIPTTTGTSSSSYTLNVDDPGNLLSSSLITQLQSVFQYSYPKLVQRFGSASSPQSVTLTASPTLASAHATAGTVTVAETIGSHITVNATFQNQYPAYLGWLTHELTHVVQGYSTTNVPLWFVEGMAEYGRYYYAPAGANPAQFNVLNAPTASDTAPQPYTTAARFLIWLQQHTSPTIVDQLNKAVQTGQDFTATFQQITGGTVDQLWAQYVADPTISDPGVS